MKKNKIILGVVAAASLCGADAMAQITYHNGDMLAGFRTQGGSTDVIVDLGSISLYQNLNGISFTPNSGVASALTSTFGGSMANVNWSVFGFNDTGVNPHDTSVTQGNRYTIWTTSPGADTTDALFDSTHQVTTDMSQIIGTISGGTGAGAGIVDVPSSAGGLTYQMQSWDGSNPGEGNFAGDWLGVELKGSGNLSLYQFEPGSQGSLLGSFNLSSGGDLAFNPVPEPSTWAMLGTGLMTLIAIRRSRRN
jgi:PEP-CTERM motif